MAGVAGMEFNRIQRVLTVAQEPEALEAILQPDRSWGEVAAKSVAVNARVRIKPGERIALDGTLVSGRSTINQAPITGESLPVVGNGLRLLRR